MKRKRADSRNIACNLERQVHRCYTRQDATESDASDYSDPTPYKPSSSHDLARSLNIFSVDGSLKRRIELRMKSKRAKEMGARGQGARQLIASWRQSPCDSVPPEIWRPKQIGKQQERFRLRGFRKK
jgi:hypothetical protein